MAGLFSKARSGRKSRPGPRAGTPTARALTWFAIEFCILHSSFCLFFNYPLTKIRTYG
jgi:hypothetical protein